MPVLFNVDIADRINKALGPKLLGGTLTKRRIAERVPGQPKGDVRYDTTDHAFRGLIKTLTQRGRTGTSVNQPGQAVLVLGGSLPAGVIPARNDIITIEDQEFKITGVHRDPAAATYTCEVG